jgi:hypothetical protein
MAPVISAIKDYGYPVGINTPFRRTVFYFTFQSQHLGFSEMVYLLTLCLAPLGMHILAGAPAPVVLNKEHPPQWKDRILLLNPTTIYWRYYTITLRVVEAKEHSAVEMGPANAVFWVGEKKGEWSGSEAMIEATRVLLNEEIAKEPFKFPRLSASTFQTIVITIQGVQALFVLFSGIRLGGYALAVSLPNIFQPVAIAGLFRLACSIWLRDDCYTNLADDNISEVMKSLRDLKSRRVPESLQLTESLQITESFQPPESVRVTRDDSLSPKRKNRPWRKWLAVAVKILFLSITAALLAMALWYFDPNPRVRAGTASTLLVNILYVVFLIPTLTMTFVYTVRGKTGTTIIPCINTRLYRVYTYMLFGFAGVVLVITAIETRRVACPAFSTYTTYPERLGYDKYLCS